MDVICTFFNDIVTQIKKEGQYITWILVFIGWLIAGVVAFLVAKWQEQKNVERTNADLGRARLEKAENLKKELIERIVRLEDEAIDFWLNPPPAYQKFIDKFSRDIKIITGIARSIDEILTHEYPKGKFLRLRRAVTLYEGVSIVAESYQGHRVQSLRDECVSIRNHYQ